MDDSEQTMLFQGSNREDKDDRASSELNGTGSSAAIPLAVRIRPKKLSGVTGQDHILGKESLLPRLIQSDSFGSILLYGPPGCGKTTLAEVIAHETNSRFIRVNAVLSNVAELRDILRFARSRPEDRTIVSIDEIHRFNKAQQDLLLPDVESGAIRLIGATTHNPGFYVNSPLLSRSHLFRLNPLSKDAIIKVLKLGLSDSENGLGDRRCQVDDRVLEGITLLSDGDLRRALNALETLVMSQAEGSTITENELKVFASERQIRYDANEDEHYDTISAFIKSIRGGNPDAALYWMAKMLAGGEDPRYIARRLVILASEDVGLADSGALSLAIAAFQACEFIGLPECELNLAHVVIYLATAPKSNSAYLALGKAKKAIGDEPVQPVPLWLRDGSTKTNRALGHAANYQYSHEYGEAVSGQEYMENPLSFYQPQTAGAEEAIAKRLKHWKSLKNQLKENEAT
jgi:putative ATPase